MQKARRNNMTLRNSNCRTLLNEKYVAAFSLQLSAYSIFFSFVRYRIIIFFCFVLFEKKVTRLFLASKRGKNIFFPIQRRKSKI